MVGSVLVGVPGLLWSLFTHPPHPSTPQVPWHLCTRNAGADQAVCQVYVQPVSRVFSFLSLSIKLTRARQLATPCSFYNKIIVGDAAQQANTSPSTMLLKKMACGYLAGASETTFISPFEVTKWVLLAPCMSCPFLPV